MGKVPAEDTKRNEELIVDYKSRKFSTSQLNAKYEISTARLYQILKNYGVKLNNKKRKQK